MQFIHCAFQNFIIILEFQKTVYYNKHIAIAIFIQIFAVLFVMTVLKSELHIAFRFSTFYFRYINESSPTKSIH